MYLIKSTELEIRSTLGKKCEVYNAYSVSRTWTSKSWQACMLCCTLASSMAVKLVFQRRS